MGHEICTNLTTIKMNSHLLLKHSRQQKRKRIDQDSGNAPHPVKIQIYEVNDSSDEGYNESEGSSSEETDSVEHEM